MSLKFLHYNTISRINYLNVALGVTFQCYLLSIKKQEPNAQLNTAALRKSVSFRMKPHQNPCSRGFSRGAYGPEIY